MHTFTKYKRVWIISALFLVLGIMFLLISASKKSEPVTLVDDSLPVVTLTTANQYVGTSEFTLIGSVRAFSEAAITPERGGRVTSVRAELGQTVVAGQIIATLENASEQAAVLQAEGSYEAALAAAAQNEVGTDEAESRLRAAKNNVVTTYKSAYGSVNGTVLTTIDQFFVNPNSFIPGLRIDGRGYTETLNNERLAYQDILPEWNSKTASISIQSDLDADVAYAYQTVQRTISFIDTFITVFNLQTNDSRYTDAELAAYITEFNAARSSLIAVQTSLTNAQAQLDSAEEGVERASLAASGSQNSAADAQVKQALGSLRAAQANLAKTIIRTPITGTVNSLKVRTGDFVGAQQQLAIVANNDALEIITSIGEKEQGAFSVGDTVIIEGSIEGTVTQIAPAVDAGTGKIEMRIATESNELKNGDTVTITGEAAEVTSDTRVFVPLSAVKFNQSNGTVLVVVDGVLQARSIERGVIRGNSVEITSGLSLDEAFVVDARGLEAGLEVEVITQ